MRGGTLRVWFVRYEVQPSSRGGSRGAGRRMRAAADPVFPKTAHGAADKTEVETETARNNTVGSDAHIGPQHGGASPPI